MKFLKLLNKNIYLHTPMFTAKDISFMRTLGEGAFGRVVLVQLKEEVTRDYVFLACKVIKKRFLLETRNAENVKREIDILNQLYGCPFFPKMYSVFKFYDRLCLLMEFCEGGEMFSWIRRTNGLSYDSTRFYGAEILLSLKKLHSLNILYRDLKSENILLTASGHIKLVDFGLSIRTEDRAWSPVGTPECMAPEIISLNGYGPEADLWSFGILLYEMVHCETPFGNHKLSSDEINEGILNKEPSFSKDLDEDYVSLVKGLLCKDPRSRLGFAGIEEVMSHRFFYGIDWVEMERLNVKPPSSPNVSCEGDSRHFGFYRESIASFDLPPTSFLKRNSVDLVNFF